MGQSLLNRKMNRLRSKLKKKQLDGNDEEEEETDQPVEKEVELGHVRLVDIERERELYSGWYDLTGLLGISQGAPRDVRKGCA